jgi:hypothetical protein
MTYHGKQVRVPGKCTSMGRPATRRSKYARSFSYDGFRISRNGQLPTSRRMTTVGVEHVTKTSKHRVGGGGEA